MSGAQTSTFAPPNVLLSTLSGAQTAEVQQNQLMNQGRQIDLSNANMAQVQQTAGGLLSAYPDEASRAAAWAPTIGMLQSQGYALHAPAQYPGETVLRSLVNQSIPAKDLYSSGALMTPLQQQLVNSTQPPTTTTTGSTTGTTAPSATGPAPFVGANLPQGVTPDEDQLVRTVYGEARGEPVAGQQGVASVIKTRMGLGKQGVQDVVFAPNQFEAWSDPKNRPGMEALDPSSPQYQAILNNVVRPVMSGQAQDPTGGATNFYNPQLQAQLGRSTPGFAQGNQTTIGNHTFFYGGYAPRGAAAATATPATAPAGGVAARTGGTDTAGPAAGTTPPTAAPAGPPAAQQPLPQDQAVAQAKATGQAVPVAGTQALWALPSGNITGAPPPAAMPPAPATAPAQPPAAAPASTSRLPEVSTIPTGQNSAPYHQAMQLEELARRYDAVAGTNPAFAKQAADLRLKAAAVMQAGATVSAQQGGREGTLEVVTGKFTPYAPLPSPRFSQPTIDPATGKPAIAAVSGSGTQYFPIPASPAQADYENMKAAYTGDIPTVKTIAESGRAAQASALQLNELADVIKGVQSGGILPEFRAKVAALMEANGAKPETIQAMTGMSSGSDAQVLQKLAVATIGASAKSDLGSNVGVESLNLYAGANPGMDKLQDANKRVTNMIRVAREQINSYSLGAQQHFNQNQSTMLHTPPGQVPDYHPLSEYNEKWQAKNNPQIGAAAIGILNGDGFDKWAARAGPEEALNAVRLAARIDPNIQIPVKGGGFKTAQEVLSHGTGQ